MSLDEIRLELNKMMIAQTEHDEHIRHNAIKETHWGWYSYITGFRDHI